MAEPTKRSTGTQASTMGASTSGGEIAGRQPQTAPPINSATPRTVNAEAQNIVQQVRSTATDALQTAKTNTAAKIEEQKSTLSSGLTNVADNVRKLGDGLTKGHDADPVSRFAADYSGIAADKLDTVADYFNSHDLNAIYRDTESFARRNPAIIVGGAFALGFLAARFFKSSSEKYGEGTTPTRRPMIDRPLQPRTQTLI